MIQIVCRILHYTFTYWAKIASLQFHNTNDKVDIVNGRYYKVIKYYLH